MCSIWRSAGPPFQRPSGRPWPVPNDPRISAGIYRVFSSRCKTMGRPGRAALERSGNPPRRPSGPAISGSGGGTWDFVQPPLSPKAGRGRISGQACWGDLYGTRDPVAIEPDPGRQGRRKPSWATRSSGSSSPSPCRSRSFSGPSPKSRPMPIGRRSCSTSWRPGASCAPSAPCSASQPAGCGPRAFRSPAHPRQPGPPAASAPRPGLTVAVTRPPTVQRMR